MGRQLPIVATPSDERELLAYMATLSPIGVFISHTDTIDNLWVDDWAKRDIESYHFAVWLKAFPWKPEYKQTGGSNCPRTSAGLWYISNSNDAPVIEITRPRPNSTDGGRVYWASDFSALHGLAYDAIAFRKVVDRVWGWIRRNSYRQETAGKGTGLYFLTQAWRETSIRATR